MAFVVLLVVSASSGFQGLGARGIPRGDRINKLPFSEPIDSGLLVVIAGITGMGKTENKKFL